MITTYARTFALGSPVVDFTHDASGAAVSSSTTISYTEAETGRSGYLNGAYAGEGAYLGTESGKVKFMISGVTGLVDESKVNVTTLDALSGYSYYYSESGLLKHHIYTAVGSVNLNNGTCPSYISSGTKYYSYDGHYFYSDYDTMLSDYTKGVRTSSVNSGSPFYNYYQFLPFRSTAVYSASQFNTAINNIVSSSSKMRDIGSDLVNCQNKYGTNALLMAGIAANESAWGASNISQTKNNLFGINAVDTNPAGSANSFATVSECITEYSSRYLSKQYLRPGYTYYKGACLGNKSVGMNWHYASDPYWGEKNAATAYRLDTAMGGTDKGRYTIGIKDMLNSFTDLNIRAEASTSSSKIYTTGVSHTYPVIILGESGTFYKIQSDGVLNSSRTGVDSSTGVYDFSKNYGYASKSYITKVISGSGGTITEPENPVTPGKNSIVYSSYVQGQGWQEEVCDKATSGTTGASKQIGAVKIKLNNPSYSGSVEYSVYLNGSGWQDYKADGAVAGNASDTSSIGAIKVRLTGSMEFNYDVYYRAHCQQLGWLGWTKNGSPAGNSDFGYRMEAFEIVLVPKGGAAPGSTDEPYKRYNYLSYSVHAQTYGDLDWVADGESAGTTGESKRLESIMIKLDEDCPYTGGIEYKVHCQTYGWKDWAKDGARAGTTGESKRVEAIMIRLTGDISNKFDVYYRVHAQRYGWLDWAKNGEIAGTTGVSYRLEAIQIVLVDKDCPAPGLTDQPFKQPMIRYQADIGGYTGFHWSSVIDGGGVCGTYGQARGLENIKIQLTSLKPYSGGISYSVYDNAKSKWFPAVSNNQIAGYEEDGHIIGAIKINLTGTMAQKYDVYYRVHCQTYGWLDWAKNGQAAGTGQGKRVEAIQIMLVLKNDYMPGTTTMPFIN